MAQLGNYFIIPVSIKRYMRITLLTINRTLRLLLLLLLLIVVQTSKEYGAQKRVQLLLSITKGKQTYIIIQYLLYTRPYIHIDKLLNSY